MSMRTFRFLHLAILAVLVGSAALVYAQDDKRQDDQPAKQEAAKPDVKPDQAKPDEAKPAQQDEVKPSKEEKKEEKQDKKEMQQQSHDQAMPEKQNHPMTTAQAGGVAGKGGHIPDDKFKAHFGRSHTFTAKTVIVSGQPQFQYGGYTFQLVDAWPVGWAYTDDCYIDYIDGEYFLFDLLHPGMQVAIFVVL
jgi:hypothetical protein